MMLDISEKRRYPSLVGGVLGGLDLANEDIGGGSVG